MGNNRKEDDELNNDKAQINSSFESNEGTSSEITSGINNDNRDKGMNSEEQVKADKLSGSAKLKSIIWSGVKWFFGANTNT